MNQHRDIHLIARKKPARERGLFVWDSDNLHSSSRIFGYNVAIIYRDIKRDLEDKHEYLRGTKAKKKLLPAE